MKKNAKTLKNARQGKKSDFDRSLEAKHGYRSYKSHFKPLYMATGLFCSILLACSAFFSAQFFAGVLSDLGEGAIYAGFLLSGIVAMFIGLLMQKALTYYDAEGMVEPVLGIALGALIALNAYGDFAGAERWGSEMTGAAPTDTKTIGISDRYEKQIADIDAKIDAIEARNFYWCGEHQARHKCDNPENKRYVNMSEKSDRKALRDIERLNQQREQLVGSMDALVRESSSAHSKAVGNWEEELQASQGRMQGASILCMGLYMLLSFWRHNYGRRAISERTPSPASEQEPQPEPQPQPEKADKEAFNNALEKIRNQMKAEMERHLEESARESQALREELRATKEAHRDFFDGGIDSDARGKN